MTRHHNQSLAWCVEFGRNMHAADLTTARNVLNCIVPHARRSAFTADEIAAVDRVEAKAKAMLDAAGEVSS